LDVARALGCTESDAMAAVSDRVAELPAGELESAMERVRGWGQVLALVRNADAVAEIDVPGDGWYIRNGWLNWITDEYNLHIRVANLVRLLGLTREGMHGVTHSLNLVNEAGEVFFRVYARNEAARESFEELCRPHLRSAEGAPLA
jgi:putative heme iron utilization protein